MANHKIVCYRFFYLDYQAMVSYLESMAEKGWFLEKINFFSLYFVRCHPEKLRFGIEFLPSSPKEKNETKEIKKEEYIILAQQFGWTF